MKKQLLVASILILFATTLPAAVWNYPQNGNTVGNPTYFDCTAPGSPQYMKLWIYGSSTSLWTVHNTNHLAFVYYLPNGNYTMNCQYNDGTTHDNFITITVTDNLYDKSDADDDPYTPGSMPYWEIATGCSGGCSRANTSTSLDTTHSTDGQSRLFQASMFTGTGTDDYQDVYYYEKRCGGTTAIGRRAGHYMVNFNALGGATPRGYEFGFTQWFNGRNYRMAFQALYSSGVWRMYDPGAGTWIATNVTTAQAPIPTSGFKRVYLVGHPYTDANGNERVQADLVQIGECTNAPCADTDADPVRPVPFTSGNTVPSFAESCAGGEGNSQSVQIDLDRTRTSSTIWTDKYWVHLQP